MRISDWSSDVCSSDLGDGGFQPDGWETHERLPFAEVQAILARADIVFCHGGTGSLVTGTQAGCRVIAMPRTAARGEHYDDHQEEIVTAFAAREIGRAACRERVCRYISISVGAGSLRKKPTHQRAHGRRQGKERAHAERRR